MPEMISSQTPVCPGPIAGIDVSKEWLDVCCGREVVRVANDRAAIESLCKELKDKDIRQIGLEPTGGYEVLAVTMLRAAGFDVRMVDSWRLRQFAKAGGTRAKTDRLDARMIRDFTRRESTRPWPEPGKEQAALTLWVREASRADADLVRLKTRLAACQLDGIRTLLEAEIEALRRSIKAIEAEIIARLGTAREFAAKAMIMLSVPGVGIKTVRVLMAELPELGTLADPQIAALAGLAPYHRHSGKRTTKSTIEGGRAALKRAAFLAARTAIRYSLHFKRLYEKFRAAGKPAKVATVAIARKLIVTLNAMIRNGTTWAPA
jgi:transposase